MKFKEITSVNELPSVMKLFEGGAKLLSLEYIACGKDSITNDVKDAILKFKGGTEFAFKVCWCRVSTHCADSYGQYLC